jgi:hypothetical protein
MFLPGTGPIPFEYRFMALDELVRGEPGELIGRPLIAVDAANEDRLGGDRRLVSEASMIVVIDHHHDNSRFGKVNLVAAETSSTAESLRDVFTELGVRLTPDIAEALYIAVVTDTGRFQYANTSPKTLRLAAELLEAGADAHRIFQHVYETIELSKLKLLARSLSHVEVFEGGRLVISYLERKDFEETGATSGASEGVIDSLRAIADALGGHCLTLRRLEVGPFRVADASERILTPAEALSFLPAIELSEKETEAVRAGRTLERAEQGRLRLLHSDELVAVGRGADATVRAETVMPV